MIRLLACALLALLLIGCATPPTPPVRVVTQEVKVAVPVPCAPRLGPEPDYPDTEAALLAAPNIFERVKLLVAGRLLRIQRDAEKTAALNECRGAP